MKKWLIALVFTWAPVVTHAACVPGQAVSGMIGCWPVVTSMSNTTDYLDIWRPGVFPASAQLITPGNLAISMGGPFLPLTGGTLSGSVNTSAALIIAGSGGVSGGSRAWSGASFAQTPVTTGGTALTWTGTTGAAGVQAPLGFNFNLSASLDTTLSFGGATGGNINITAGSGLIGGLSGLVSTINISGATANTGGQEYVPLRGFGYVSSDDGSGGRSTVYGQTLVAQAGTVGGAVFSWGTLGAAEFAIQVFSGVTLSQKFGRYVKRYSGDAVQGTSVDAADAYWADAISTGTTGWKVLWQIGNAFNTNYNPMASNATLMLFDPRGGDVTTIANGFDLSKYTSITDHAFKFGSVLWADGSGNLDRVGDLTQNPSGFWTFKMSAGTSGIIFRNSGGASLAQIDGSGNITSTSGLVQAPFIRVGSGTTFTTLVNVAGSGINVTLPAIASTLAILGANTFTATQTAPTFNATTGFSANGTAGLASKVCITAGATITITEGLITATSGC